LDFERLKTFVLTVVDEFWERDYFVEAFGYYCVDNDWVEGARAVARAVVPGEPRSRQRLALQGARSRIRHRHVLRRA
jgi:hypothetical protein